MQSSIFSYPISRAYPYKWFTWVTIVGGILAVVIFSSVNLAANGYNLAITYTTDYNGTVGVKRWTSHFPFSLFEKTVASCQTHDVPVNSQFFTDKLSLPYTLTSVWQSKPGNTSIIPSLRYLNNRIEDCVITLIGINLESSRRTALQQGFLTWGPKAFAELTCIINNDVYPTYFNMTVDYEYVPVDIRIGQPYSFLQPKSNQTQASLWWGESLLSWYWLNLAKAMKDHSSFTQFRIVQGVLTYTTSGNTSDMNDLSFFANPSFDFVFDQLDEDGNFVQLSQCCLNPGQANQSVGIGGWVEQNYQPNIWIQGDSFAKVFYATIMADLGQTSLSSLLSNTTLLQFFSANITEMTGSTGNGVETPWLFAGPARQPYSEIKAEVGPLEITPSTIYAQYFCQVPELKSRGSLIIAILVADLVFLQALWQLLSVCTSFWLKRKNPQARYCEGCLKYLEATPGTTDGVEMSPPTGWSSSADDGMTAPSNALAIPSGIRRKPLTSSYPPMDGFESRDSLLGPELRSRLD